MVNRDALHDLASRITSLLPDHMQQMQDDLESNIHSLLQNTLAKMNLVTREEFDVQTALLQRTREKLERLEQRLAELEKARP
jgi:BMFP domain-containing protein YqiC